MYMYIDYHEVKEDFTAVILANMKILDPDNSS